MIAICDDGVDGALSNLFMKEWCWRRRETLEVSTYIFNKRLLSVALLMMCVLGKQHRLWSISRWH